MAGRPPPGPRSRTRDLLRELYGPGKSRYEQQSDPHLIATWDPFEPDPVRTDATLDDRAAHLNRPAKWYAQPLLRYVWHCTALTARHDRVVPRTRPPYATCAYSWTSPAEAVTPNDLDIRLFMIEGVTGI